MSLTQLAPPYPIFTDKDGSPLDNGYLYFGEINKNPETNPIQVYYDTAFTQPAAQPLRTSNGYVMRNGSPALVYASTQFSVTVRDKNNALVIYSPVGYGIDPEGIAGIVTTADHTGDGSTVVFGMGASPISVNATSVYIDGVYQEKDTYTVSGTNLTFSEAPPFDASIEIVVQQSGIIGGTSAELVTYNQGSVGAVSRTVKNKLQETVSVEDFGAVGDGVTDDTAAIQAALDAASAAGGGAVYLPQGDYRISSALEIDNYTILHGASIHGTRLIPVSGTSQTTLVKNKPNSGQNPSTLHISIRDLTIDANDEAAVTDALVLEGVGRSQVFNIRVRDASASGAHGIRITSYNDGGTYRQASKNSFYDVYVLNCYNGVIQAVASGDPSTSGPTHNTWTGGEISGYSDKGFNCDAGEGLTMTGVRCQTSNNNTVQIRLNDDVPCLVNCIADNTYSSGGESNIGIQVTNNVTDACIINNIGNLGGLSGNTRLDDNGARTIVFRSDFTQFQLRKSAAARVTVSGGILAENNVFIRGEQVAGTDQNMIGINSSDVVQIANSNIETEIRAANEVAFTVPAKLPSYLVANLPSSGVSAGGMAYCSNETGGATIVFYDGTNWRRVQDRAIAS